jgi:hypothetical protein
VTRWGWLWMLAGGPLWPARATDLELVAQSPGARSGTVHVQGVADGVRISGEVDGPAPDFPKIATDMLRKDHVEVWLALIREPKLPPIGWGNQFGQEVLANADACVSKEPDSRVGDEKECRAWFAKQVAYRAQFRRLFVRQWLLAPGIVQESYATPAFAAIAKRPEADKGNSILDLKPAGAPRFATGSRSQGYTFDAEIPWSAFPPSDSLTIDKVLVMVDVFRAAQGSARFGPFSSTSRNRKYGDPNTFIAVALSPPRAYHISACGYPLRGQDVYRKIHPALFRPIDSTEVERVFVLQNEAIGYQYTPGGLSPITRPTQFFTRNAGAGETVCGPILAYTGKGKTKIWPESILDEEGFAVRAAPDGALLVKSGPRVYYSEFGSGMCGACARVELTIVRIDPLRMSATRAFWLYDIPEQSGDRDIHLSSDWSQVQVYQQALTDDPGKRPWTLTTHCLRGAKYEVCGKRWDVRPPAKRSVEPLKE